MALALLALLPIGAWAQEATLSGTVTDTTGGVLPGVTITATHTATGNTFVAVTDERGGYRIPVRVGMFKVDAELPGFGTVTRQVDLLVGQTATLNLQMAPSTVQETVTVKCNLRHSTSNFAAPDLVDPYSHQASLGFARQIGNQASLEVNWVYTGDRAQLNTRNINVSYDPATGNPYPLVGPRGAANFINRPYPGWGTIITNRSDGRQIFEVFNLFNRANYDPTTFQLNEQNAKYGQPNASTTTAYSPRMLQFGFRTQF